MTVEELIDLLRGMPLDAKVYYKMYSVAGYLEEIALVRDYHFMAPAKHSYPENYEKCFILDCMKESE